MTSRSSNHRDTEIQSGFFHIYILFLTLSLMGCVVKDSPLRTSYHHATDLKTDHLTLYRSLYREILALHSNQQSDPGIQVGHRSFALRTEQGAAHPIIVELRNDGEVQILDTGKILSPLPFGSLEGIRFNSSATKVALIVRPAPELDRLVVAVDLTNLKEYSFDTGDISDLKWIDDHTFAFTTLIDSLPREVSVVKLRNGATVAPKSIYREQDPAIVVAMQPIPGEPKLLIEASSPSKSEVRVVELSEENETQQQTLFARRPGTKHHVTAMKGGLLALSSQTDRRSQLRFRDYSSIRWKALSSPTGQGTAESVSALHNTVLLTTRNGIWRTLWRGDPANDRFTAVVKPSPNCNPRFSEQHGGNEVLRYWCSSFQTPPVLFEYSLKTGKASAVSPISKNDRLPTSFHTVEARNENVVVPVTVVSQDQVLKKRPTLLIAYGAYGEILIPEHQPWLTVLLRRGFNIAFAHVRGGGYHVPSWHKDATGANKARSVEDLLAAAGLLKEQKITKQLFAYGKSAGAMLVASAAQRAPDIFDVLVLDSPLLNVRRAVTDPKLPLMWRERYEWGNPLIDSEVDQAMQAYSPIEAAVTGPLPPLLARVGALDTFTPPEDLVTWLEKVDIEQPSQQLRYIRMIPDSGHLGAYNSYDQLEEDALMLTFLLSRERPPVTGSETGSAAPYTAG